MPSSAIERINLARSKAAAEAKLQADIDKRYDVLRKENQHVKTRIEAMTYDKFLTDTASERLAAEEKAVTQAMLEKAATREAWGLPEAV